MLYWRNANFRFTSPVYHITYNVIIIIIKFQSPNRRCSRVSSCRQYPLSFLLRLVHQTYPHLGSSEILYSILLIFRIYSIWICYRNKIYRIIFCGICFINCSFEAKYIGKNRIIIVYKPSEIQLELNFQYLLN